MKKRIGLLATLVVGPIVGIGSLLPVAADVSVGGASACAPQSANPHPTDPAGSTATTLFCTGPTPTPSPTAGTGRTAAGSGGRSGSSGSGGSSGGTTAAGSQTTLANSAGTGPTTPATHGAGGGGATAGKSAAGNASPAFGGLFGGLVGFFSATGGLVFLFGLLVLMAIVLIAIGVVSWLRRGRVAGWASHARSLSFRPKS
jgi:hypothetical protein